MRAATEGSLPPVMPQGNLVEVLGRDVRQGSPGELMVECSPLHQRRPPCKTKKEMSDEAADAAALTYLLTYSLPSCPSSLLFVSLGDQPWGKSGQPLARKTTIFAAAWQHVSRKFHLGIAACLRA